MATFVLVHGAFAGGWVWKKLAPLLREAGHDVFTPTLTGLGEREHLATRDIGLDIHVQDILAMLTFEDLHEVVLVGHSYAGMVITSLADEAADRLAQLVYFDAHAPRDGESLLDLGDPARRTALEQQVERGDGWRIPPPPPETWAYWVARGLLSEEEAGWVDTRVRPQPLKTFLDPARLTDRDALALPRSYIYCTEFESPPTHARSVERAKAAGWRYRELASGHVAQLLAPHVLAEALLDIA